MLFMLENSPTWENLNNFYIVGQNSSPLRKSLCHISLSFEESLFTLKEPKTIRGSQEMFYFVKELVAHTLIKTLSVSELATSGKYLLVNKVD